MGEFPTNATLAAAVVIQCLKNPCNGSLQLVSTDRGLFVYREVIWQELGDDELKRIITFLSVEAAANGEGKKPLSSDKIGGTLRQIRSYTFEQGLSGRLGVCKFNGDGTITERFDVIPMRNGLLDINTDELIPHSADWFYTNTLPFDYDKDAKCPQWLAWLAEVFCGDQEQIDRMQEWFGLNLTRDTKFQKFALLKGAPRSGKGTTLKVLEHLVGKNNYCGAELYQLASDPTLLAMSNVQTCTMGDVHTIQGNDQNKILSKIKSIVGEDEQLINRKFLTAITCRIPAKITMAANSVPQFFDESGALAARILLFIYRRGHGGNEIDTGLFARLIKEDTGIFLWALEGLRRLYSVGRFSESTMASQYMKAIKEDTQPTLAFIESCLEITGMPEHKVPVTQVYDLYKRWSFMSDRKPLSPSYFADKLQSASGELVHRGKGRIGSFNGSVFIGCKISESGESMSTPASNVVPMPNVGGGR
jgi:P4 family phage/plasmid primase-like protien